MKNESISLGKIFRGAVLILAGFLGGGVLTLGLQVMLARYFQPDLYGLFSQGMSVLYTLVMVSLLGMNAGISRHISYNSGDEKEAARAVGSSLLVVFPLSVFLFAALFLNAELVAEQIFSDSRMTEVLKIFAFAGPAMAVNSILISGFRGHQRSRERVVFLDFVIPFLQILFVGVLLFAGYKIAGTVAGYASAFVISSFGLVYWYRKNYSFSYGRETFEELVRLSWPLMVSAVVAQVFIWSPPIIVGALATSRDSGLLNTALPLASSAKMFLSSVAFLYLPVISELYGKDQLEELKEVHSSASRWITYLSVPLLGFFFIYSSSAIGYVFGESYATAGTALSVMALGFLFNSATGPLGELLIAAGKTRREMVANTAKLGLFALLSFLLIPELGFIGAAVAYAAGLVVGDLSRLFFARDSAGFFYDRNFLKPLVAVSGSFLLTSPLSTGFIPLIAAWGLIYSTLMVLMKPLSATDHEIILSELEDRGLKHPLVIRALRFLTQGR